MQDQHFSLGPERREYTFAHTDSRADTLRALDQIVEGFERLLVTLYERRRMHTEHCFAEGCGRVPDQIDTARARATQVLMSRDVLMEGWERDDARGYRY
jgi:hypothetical protein